MSHITKFEIAVAVVGALTFAGIAAIAPPAQAMDQGNPWLPTIVQSDGAAPMKVSDPAYCSKEITKTCQGLDIYAGVGQGNKIGLEAREGRHYVAPKPVKPPCEPKGGDEGDTGGDTGSPAAGKMKG